VNAAEAAGQRQRTGKTFPADEVVWGIAIRNGFDEMDDPGYHRGTTQHAYLEGNDNVAICGFRPPQSGPRTRRRSRLGLPSSGENPMCGMCARMVVAPRPRVPIPIQPGRPPVALPIAPGTLPAPVAPGAGPPMTVGAMPAPVPAGATPIAVPPGVALPSGAPPLQAPTNAPAAAPAHTPSPWVRRRSGVEEPEPMTITVDLAARHDSGLLERGVHADLDDD
jgi:hypothetical protein